MTAPALTLVTAILDLHRAALPGVEVFDAIVPGTGGLPGPPPQRYAVVYPDTGSRGDQVVEPTVEQVSTGALFRWQTTCVAPDREMAAWLAATLQAALVDTRPAPAGWAAGLIEHTLSLPPRTDETVLDRPVVVAIDRYQLLAEQST